jgi:ribosome-associated protein
MFGNTSKIITSTGIDMSEYESDLSEAQAKRSIQKLQKTIVNALEDIKAVDIRVFNTEAMSPLFERVIIASGNSNRQTKALAASVRDELRKEGFPKPRSEGEENGEWIIVDCGAAVVHIMQPAIRQYYHLEDIWGEKPIRLKATTAPAKKASSKAGSAKSKPAKSAGTAQSRPPRSGGAAAKTAKPAAKPAGKTATKTAGKTAGKTAAKSTSKSAARSTTKSASRAPSKSRAAASSKAAPRRTGSKP